jgi:hypothetical protein
VLSAVTVHPPEKLTMRRNPLRQLIESFAAFVILATIRIWIRFVHTT